MRKAFASAGLALFLVLGMNTEAMAQADPVPEVVDDDNGDGIIDTVEDNLGLLGLVGLLGLLGLFGRGGRGGGGGGGGRPAAGGRSLGRGGKTDWTGTAGGR